MSHLGNMPSLATATSTRLDSACKHIQQCRVSQDHMTQLVNSDADELIRNKYRYCVHKDEMVVGITRGLGEGNNTKKFQNSAYPRVLSNMGQLLDQDGTGPSQAERVLKLLYHYSRSLSDREKLLKIFNEGNKDHVPAPAGVAEQDRYLATDPSSGKLRCKSVMTTLFDLVPVGYANTLGWAHAHCGDTMSSVMIGGLRTVRNGHFEVFTGDMLQWYWGFEHNCFLTNGQRKKVELLPDGVFSGHGLRYNLQKDPGSIDTGTEVRWDAAADTRREFRDRQYGQKKGVEKSVPLIKPFMLDHEAGSIYDWQRVFARALAPARPFEELDIMIFRQAL